MGSFLKCRLDQAFPPNNIFVCFLLKTSFCFHTDLSGERACLQGSALIYLHHTDSRDSCCFKCACYFPYAAVTCVRACWTLSNKANNRNEDVAKGSSWLWLYR